MNKYAKESLENYAREIGEYELIQLFRLLQLAQENGTCECLNVVTELWQTRLNSNIEKVSNI